MLAFPTGSAASVLGKLASSARNESEHWEQESGEAQVGKCILNQAETTLADKKATTDAAIADETGKAYRYLNSMKLQWELKQEHMKKDIEELFASVGLGEVRGPTALSNRVLDVTDGGMKSLGHDEKSFERAAKRAVEKGQMASEHGRL